MDTVLVCRSSLLTYSETFIKEQATACRRWRPILVGKRRVPGVDLDGLEVRLPSVWPRQAWPLFRELDLAPPGAALRLRGEGPAVLHAHFGWDGVGFWPLARALRLPMVVTLHGSDINIRREWWETYGRFGIKKYPRRLLQLAERPEIHFIAVGEAVRRSAIDYGLPAERIRVLYIGVDVDKFHANSLPITARRRRVLFVGRFVENKGCRYLVEAFARVRARIADAELVLVGDGPEMGRLREMAGKIGDSVIFVGHLPHDRVVQHLSEARVFCLPSVTLKSGASEGMPIVVLEAQACGTPVITSARGASTEGIVPGQTGFSFPEGDVDALENCLTELLLDDALAERMSGAAPAFVAGRFDIRRCTEALEDFYTSLI